MLNLVVPYICYSVVRISLKSQEHIMLGDIGYAWFSSHLSLTIRWIHLSSDSEGLGQV